MKKTFLILSLIALMTWLCFYTPSATAALGSQQTIAEAQSEAYNGPKARLAVGEFQDKTAKGGGEISWMGMFGMSFKQIGDGMRDMLTTALFNSNRYIVLERAQLHEVLQEQDLATAGRIKKGTEAKTGEIYGADLIVTAAVTEFEGSAKGIGGATKVLGVAVGGGLKKAHLAIDLRIIDATTSQIVAATSVEGSATSFGAAGATNIGGSLPVALGGFSKTPTEKAIRACIQKAVDYVVSKTPPDYYKYRK